ncbi:pentatricopeptide repeat-containing family protein [Salix suchowensis]|nr:pentatricopeptide repeat-containing family protein [Salix suchowensis]
MNRGLFSVLNERQKFANFLRFCSKSLFLDQGMQVHGALVKMGFGFDLMLSNDLIVMYGKCGRLGVACDVFDRMLERNVVSWTALMCGHIQNGNPLESLLLFSKMALSGVKPNDFTFSTNLKACGLLNGLYIGRQVHDTCVKTGFDTVNVVGNSIIDMYSKCGRINEAASMFEVMPVRNLISWNAMIAGYTVAGFCKKALVLFRKMQEGEEFLDEFTFTSTLKACSDLGAIKEGNQIHAFLITGGFLYSVNTAIAGALIDLYVKCGELFMARRVFSHIEEKHVISWTALILGYAQEGNLEESMDLFRQLRESSIQVDGFILSSMMGVFADFALVQQGKQMHAFAIKVPSGVDISVRNSILDMYLKCGMINEAERLFSEMPARNVISWTVLITGYGKHGLGKEAIRLFDKMQLDGTEPDDVSYLAVLLGCSHSGLVEKGQEYFSRLCSDHRIKARVEHYACMVDLLGRAGRLKEAKKLVDSMPLKANVGIWQALLSACRVHGDVELGKEVGGILLGLDSENPVNYVMMSNIYADAGYWKECERIRELIHFFYGGDDMHPLTEKIHEILKEMERRMKEELGYVYRVKYALHDVEEESKMENLRVHSEKLAIGLALVCGGLEEERKVIRVFKNLRVCGDCHEFIKGLSKILKIVFVVRDANRFHRFEDGLCSCGDYW